MLADFWGDFDLSSCFKSSVCKYLYLSTLAVRQGYDLIIFHLCAGSWTTLDLQKTSFDLQLVRIFFSASRRDQKQTTDLLLPLFFDDVSINFDSPRPIISRSSACTYCLSELLQLRNASVNNTNHFSGAFLHVLFVNLDLASTYNDWPSVRKCQPVVSAISKPDQGDVLAIYLPFRHVLGDVNFMHQQITSIIRQ